MSESIIGVRYFNRRNRFNTIQKLNQPKLKISLNLMDTASLIDRVEHVYLVNCNLVPRAIAAFKMAGGEASQRSC